MSKNLYSLVQDKPILSVDDSSPGLLTSREVAALLRCSERSLRIWRKQGRIPEPVTIGSAVRWERATLARWIAAGCPPLSASLNNPPAA